MCVATLVFDQRWLIVVLAYGFVARVLTGPTLSPLGQLVTRVLTPALPFAAEARARTAEALRPGHRRVPVASTALVLAFGFDETTAA